MNRRKMMQLSFGGGVAAAVGSLPVAAHPAAPRVDESPDLRVAVAGGVAYMRQRCDEQLPLLGTLIAAIEANDLRAAQAAYIEARAPYEQIETISYGFAALDRDIDARPYAFRAGESDAEFRGFHRIEGLLFGHEDVAAALPFAQQLVVSVRELRRTLETPTAFSAAGHFGGMFALANEIAAKKISSEEEAWSDQSMLIFRHNWIGIDSQFKPFIGILGRSNAAAADQVRNALDMAMALVEPHFKLGSAAGTPYSRIRTSERRQIADASNRIRDAIVEAARELDVTIG